VSESVFTRRALLTLFVLAVFGVLAVRPTWAQSIGADVWNVPALKEHMRELQIDIARLDAEDEQVRDRIAVKGAFVADLAAGRTTLVETTARFAELNTDRPRYMATLRRIYPAATDRETIARNVIEYTLLSVAPDERSALSSRLEAELRQMLSGSTH
jgi:hypothetical protein